MNRLWLGITLLVLFLIFGIAVSLVLNNVQQPVVTALEEASRQALSQTPEAGAATAERARTLWTESWHGIAAVSVHGPMEEIDSLFAQLPLYAEGALWGDFSACCARLAKLVEAIGETQSFNWWSLL